MLGSAAGGRCTHDDTHTTYYNKICENIRNNQMHCGMHFGLVRSKNGFAKNKNTKTKKQNQTK